MTERPTSDEARDWLKKHLALAPERDQAWAEEILAVYLGETLARPSRET